jgi:hypothetical protein
MNHISDFRGKMNLKNWQGVLFMQVTEAINWRHSIRVFLPQPVEKEKLNAVLAASVRAPSWENTQLRVRWD